MEQTEINSLVRLYSLALAVLLACLGFGVFGMSGSPSESSGWSEIFSGLLGLIMFGFLVALPGIIWLLVKSRALSDLEEPEQIRTLHSIWKFQSGIGTLNLVGTGILLIVFLLMLLLFIGTPIGLDIFSNSPLGFFTVLTLFPSVLGSVFHFVALSIKRKMASPAFSPIG